MVKYLFLLLCLLAFNHSFASSIPDDIRREYAIKFHEAFVLQSAGNTRSAYYHFKTAYQLAKKAGESSHKLKLMNDLFIWYRTYGYSMGVMSKQSGCVDESRGFHGRGLPISITTPLAKIPDYCSEWGSTPEQAAIIREFMLGVGETISGIFCITVSSGLGAGIGFTLAIDGARRMFSTLNDLWADHERSCIEFKEWQAKVATSA